MARNEDISSAIWQDEDFDALSVNAAFLYIWSFTNQLCGMAGIYRVLRREICAGRLSSEDCDNALKELADAGFLYYVDGVLWVRTRVKHLRTKGQPMQKSILSDLRRLDPSTPLVAKFCEEYRDSWIRPAIEEFLEGASGGSEGVQEIPSTKPEVGTPGEPPEGFQGKGNTTTERRTRKKKQEDVNQPPSGFPETLLPVAKECVEILHRLAVAKGAKPVPLLAVCRMMEARPNRGDYRKHALDLENWALHGNGEKQGVKDVLAKWRNWLDRVPEVAQPKPSSNGKGGKPKAGDYKYAEYDAMVENWGGSSA